jgi:hypothetical protein
MSTIEERLQALEDEHTILKKTIELQTIAIGALVNKAALEKLNEKHDKLFETLISHDHFTNEQLAELRNQQNELDGKIVGLQTEMHLQLTEQNNNITNLDGKIVGLQTEMHLRFTEVNQRFNQFEGKLDTILNLLKPS